MFIGLTGCNGTTKSVNRTYAIYGFIYPFYGFLHIPLRSLDYRNVIVIRARTVVACRNVHAQRSHANPLNIHIGQCTGSPAARRFAIWSVVTVLPTRTDCGYHFLFNCLNTFLKNAIRLPFPNLCLRKPPKSSLYRRFNLLYMQGRIFSI